MTQRLQTGTLPIEPSPMSQQSRECKLTTALRGLLSSCSHMHVIRKAPAVLFTMLTQGFAW